MISWQSRCCPICYNDSSYALYTNAKFDESSLNEFSFASRKLPDGMYFAMYRCSNCNLVYVREAPESEWLNKQYHGADFDASLESIHAATTYCNYLERNADLLPDRSLALDIGAGDGAFLKQLVNKLDFENCLGYEPSRAPYELASSEIKSKLINDFFTDNDISTNSVSLVTCFQTLEHVNNPSELLSQVFRVLKPGGVFMTISHNVDSTMVKILGTRSPIFDIEHLQLFSAKSLEYALKHTGYRDLRIGTVKNSYPLSYWAKLAPVSPLVKKAISNILSISKLGAVRMPFYPGNIYAFGKKPS